MNVATALGITFGALIGAGVCAVVGVYAYKKSSATSQLGGAEMVPVQQRD
jgi:hypothetical protein